MLARLLKENDNTLSGEQRDWLRALLPLVTVYIYCSPCACLIHTALMVCDKVTSSLVKVAIRPDDRLVSRCCTASDRTLGLKSILDYVRQWEINSIRNSEITRFLDRIWLERRFDHMEYEQAYEYKESGKNHAIILGEVDSLAQLLQKAPGRIPKETEIWAFRTSYTYRRSFTRHFICSFIEKRQQVRTEIQLGTEVTRSKRTSSPASSENKRQKTLAMTGNGDKESSSEPGSPHN